MVSLGGKEKENHGVDNGGGCLVPDERESFDLVKWICLKFGKDIVGVSKCLINWWQLLRDDDDDDDDACSWILVLTLVGWLAIELVEAIAVFA